MTILTHRRPKNPPAAEHRYHLHMGVVGGWLRPVEASILRDFLTSWFSAPVRVIVDGDNFHEWCEKFDTTSMVTLGTVASASGHLVIDVPLGVAPLEVYEAVKGHLPWRKFLTREEIAETGHTRLTKPLHGPYVITETGNWSKELNDADVLPLDKATRDRHGWWVLIEHNDDLADLVVGPWESEAAAKWAMEDSASIEGYCCDTKRARILDDVGVLDEPMTLGDAMAYYQVLCPTDQDLADWKKSTK